ncbi:SLBB domain-containing protein [Novosphingobium sp. Chol11]|uniref:SLBB domain-containing protein n=1 Tax=Novosphingobium sp. Chol11 TaxID=1385763 RepID=UPI0025D6AD8E|nr:SLBB domain-containing protein [Novosphingobium sp. Chol11]
MIASGLSEYRFAANCASLARFFRAAAGACAISLVLSALPVAAQIDPSSLPMGSPLDPSNSFPQGGLGGGQGQGGSGGRQSVPYQPVTIGQSSGVDEDVSGVATGGPRLNANGLLDLDSLKLRQPAKPGEFEIWIRQVTGRPLKRFGADLLLPGAGNFAMPATATIPPDYALNIGDTVSIALSGSVEGSADLPIDRDGNIYLANVGSVSLLGVRYRDLYDRIAAAVGRKYRGYEVAVSIKRLRGVRVYVTGFANQPGAYSVNSLSTLVNAVLQSGGPSPGGSFRSVKLYRNGREVADFDLYELLRKGDRARDPLLENEDVLFIPPVGKQVAVVGSINEEAIYETKPGESVADMIALAGGPTNVGDASRVILYRLSDQNTVGSRELDRRAAASMVAEGGDILQILPEGTLARSLEKQQAVVRIEGEVNKPGNYFVPPNTPLATVIEMAGGLTQRAYVYGTRFSRESVRAQQRQSFLEAVDQMELSLAAAPLSGDRLIDAGERASQIAAARSFLEKLRGHEPDGRLVIDLAAADRALPGDLLLENNDRVIIPPRVETVGVFGAVYRPASFLLNPSKAVLVKDYLEQAGGPIRGGDRGNIFVVRANGSVLTKRRGALKATVLPGDTVFVPIRTQSSSVLAKIRDISQILFQFGFSAAALATIK